MHYLEISANIWEECVWVWCHIMVWTGTLCWFSTRQGFIHSLPIYVFCIEYLCVLYEYPLNILEVNNMLSIVCS